MVLCLWSRMPRSRLPLDKVYPTYQPYPLSWDLERQSYAARATDPSLSLPPDSVEESAIPDLSHPLEDWSPLEAPDRRPTERDGEPRFRPLQLMRSLFSDRLDLLNATLRELEAARDQRKKMTAAALEDIDSDIEECDRSLSLLKGHMVLNDFEKRRHLERQLLELKRQRRQETVMSWRDLLALGREIRALRREIDSLGRTKDTAKNREAPS